MTLDFLVEISQLFTPIILLGAGWFISKNLNKQLNSIRLNSDVEFKWANLIMDKCMIFQDLITDIVVGMQKTTDFGLSPEERREFLAKFPKLMHVNYDIEIHLHLVENSSKIKEIVEKIGSSIEIIIKNNEGSITNIKSLQSELSKELKEFHKHSLLFQSTSKKR